MLRKLSGRNALRQMRDYLVYLVTLILSVTLVYSFQLLVFSEEIKMILENWVMMPFIVTLVSVIIILILGRLVCYITEFMLKKRSREFGTYMLLGIENSEIASMFIRENNLVGLVAFGAGLVTGTYFYQILRAVVMHLLSAPYKIQLDFSWNALGLTALYLLVIFLLAGHRTKKIIKKITIQKLLSLERENEKAVASGKKSKILLFSTSFLALFLSGTALIFMLLGDGGSVMGVSAVVLILLFVMGFFMGLPSVLEHRFLKSKWKYSGRNLLLGRLFHGKIRNISISLGSVSVLFLMVFLAVSLGLFFNRLVESRIQQTAFDFAVCSLYGRDDLTEYEAYVQREMPDMRTFRYQIYTDKKMDFANRISQVDRGKFVSAGYSKAVETDSYIKQSDYLKLRDMLHLTSVELESDRYYLHCSDFVDDTLKDYAKDKTVFWDNTSLTFGGSFTEPFFQQEFFGNGHYNLLVVPDSVVSGLDILENLYVGTAKEELSMRQIKGIKSLSDSENIYITGKGEIRSATASVMISIVLPLFYLAMILCAAGATILTVQILSNLEQEQKYYRILTECGMDQKEQTEILRRYFAGYYIMPVLPAAVGSGLLYLAITGSIHWDVYEGMSFMGFWEGMKVLGTTGFIFFSIYLIYCLSAYLAYKKAVLF